MYDDSHWLACPICRTAVELNSYKSQDAAKNISQNKQNPMKYKYSKESLQEMEKSLPFVREGKKKTIINKEYL